MLKLSRCNPLGRNFFVNFETGRKFKFKFFILTGPKQYKDISIEVTNGIKVTISQSAFMQAPKLQT
jgi:hypothetical protein